MVRSACPPARSASIREHLTNRMSPPRRATWCPSACATLGFPDPDGSVENHRLPGLEPAQGGQGAQPRGGLGPGGIEGVEDPGEFEGLECGAQAGIVNGHDKVLCSMWLAQNMIR